MCVLQTCIWLHTWRWYCSLGLSIFLQYNQFKCRILNERITAPSTTVYRWQIVLLPFFSCTCLIWDMPPAFPILGSRRLIQPPPLSLWQSPLKDPLSMSMHLAATQPNSSQQKTCSSSSFWEGRATLLRCLLHHFVVFSGIYQVWPFDWLVSWASCPTHWKDQVHECDKG